MIDATEIAAARAAAGGRRLVDVLEERLALGADEFAARLAATFRLEPLRMLTVGDRSGTMGDMMERIAGFHDEELSRWVDWFTRLFEPLLMAFIGLVIGLIVLLMYLPIFELAGNIQ